MILLALLIGAIPLEQWNALPQPFKQKLVSEMSREYLADTPHCFEVKITASEKNDIVTFEGKCIKFGI
jgi:hypothetical protein